MSFAIPSYYTGEPKYLFWGLVGISMIFHLLILSAHFVTEVPEHRGTFKPLQIRLGSGAISGMQQVNAQSGKKHAIGEHGKDVLEAMPLLPPSSKYSHSGRTQMLSVAQQQTSENVNQINSGHALGNDSYEGMLRFERYEQVLPKWLNQFRTYPEEAKQRSLRGRGQIFLKIDRQGNILLSRILESTGHPVLDKELTRMLATATPVIPVPSYYEPQKQTLTFRIYFDF